MSSSSIDTPQPAYRADIDGLRALSVIAVILFHFAVPGFGGGFVGVDIFFVISGYLITQLLVLRSGLPFHRWLGEFYLRRARRILPALLLMLIVLTAAVTWLFAPIDFKSFGKPLALSVSMLANYAADQSGDYFANVGVSPLKHLWSIAVEEQFYLAYPLALFLILRFAPKRAQPALLGAAVLASFALCVWASAAYPRGNYYLPITRAWELGTGALLGLRTLEWSPSRGIRELLGAAALVAIVVPVIVYDENTPFPGWYALAPCLGAAALIATGAAGGSSINRLLSIRPLVFVGLISYALYLWHMPIKSIRDYYMLTPPGNLEVVVLLAVLLGVAAVTWKWFEVPLRKRRLLRSNRSFLIATGVTAAGLCGLAYCMWKSDGMPQRLSAEEQRIYSGVEPYRLWNSCLSALYDFNDGELCRDGTVDSPDNIVVLWGDSHALVLLPAAREVAERHRAELRIAIAPGCPPLMEPRQGETSSGLSAECQNFNRAVARAIKRARPRVVILAGYWAGPGYYGGEGRRVPADLLFSRRLEEMLPRVRADGRRICLMRDPPEFHYSVPHALASAHRRSIEPDFNVLTLKDARLQQAPFDAQFDRLESLGLFVSVNPREALCASGTCPMAGQDGNPLYRDTNHLVPAGAKLLEPLFEKCLAGQ